jgi:Flp pilus assembly pilin Flp
MSYRKSIERNKTPIRRNIRMLSNTIKSVFFDEDATAMVEYVLITALIAVAGITAISLFGDQLKSMFKQSIEALSGRAPGKEESAATKTGDILFNQGTKRW